MSASAISPSKDIPKKSFNATLTQKQFDAFKGVVTDEDQDFDLFFDQSSVTFTEDFSSSLLSSSNIDSALDTLTASLASLTETTDSLQYNKKSYHKCNAENRDPRCVCSAKLGLDFPSSKLQDSSPESSNNLDSPNPNNEFDHDDIPFDRSLLLEGIDQSKDSEDSRSSVAAGSRRSSLDSEFLEDKDSPVGAQGGATDSGVGSSRSGKYNCSEATDDVAPLILPPTPRDLSSDHFPAVFSPKSSCDSDPEESSSQQGTYRSKRRTLSDSESSWSSSFSSNGYLNDLVAECEQFMKVIASKIFNPSSDISQQEKARFGQLCQHGAGRQWFAKYVNDHRSTQNVAEIVFFRLQQFFSVCLFECDHEDDYVPAKCLMLLCFVFYTDLKPPHGNHEYLFSGIRTQLIWRSLKFWNAAFFDAVHCEGVHRGPNRSSLQEMKRNVQRHRDDIFSGIVFEQLKEFTKFMNFLEVPKELNVEFLVKQSMVGKLSDDQTCTLRENIEILYGVTSNDQ